MHQGQLYSQFEEGGSDESDEISAAQVTKLIEAVKTKHKEYKDAGAEKYAADELKLIDDYIKSAQKFLTDEENSRAFYEISIGKAYFIMVDAWLGCYQEVNFNEMRVS